MTHVNLVLEPQIPFFLLFFGDLVGLGSTLGIRIEEIEDRIGLLLGLDRSIVRSE